MLESPAGSLHRLIDLGAAPLADRSDHRFICRVDHFEAAASFYESPIDKMPKTAAMFFQPSIDEIRALRRRAVFHGCESFFNCRHVRRRGKNSRKDAKAQR